MLPLQVKVPIGSIKRGRIFIYIEWLIFMVNIGKYASPVDPPGFSPILKCFQSGPTDLHIGARGRHHVSIPGSCVAQ